MGIMRRNVYNRLKETYPDVRMTCGYITKNVRIENDLNNGKENGVSSPRLKAWGFHAEYHMKKYFSVLKLYMNEIFGRAAAVMAFLITGETGLYLLKGRHEPALGAALMSSRAGLFLAASYLMLIILPAYMQGTSGARTLGRLRISNGATFLMGSLAYSLQFLLLWLVQACVLILLTALYVRSPLYVQGTQGILAVFYRNDLLHALIPLRDTHILIRNGIICLCSGIATSYMRRSFENGKYGFAAVWAYLLAFISFRAQSGGYTAAAFLLAISAYLIFCLIGTRSEDNENDQTE